MTVITRTITNNLSKNLELFVPGYNTLKPQVVIAPSATVDLFTVLTGDELSAVQNQLVPLIANSSITVNATVNTNTFNPTGSMGSAIWGDITGTLSSQIDLQNALNAKLSLTGGTLTGALAITVNTSSAMGEIITNSNSTGSAFLSLHNDAGKIYNIVMPGSAIPALGVSGRPFHYSVDNGLALIADGVDNTGIYLVTQGSTTSFIRAVFDATSYVKGTLAVGGTTPDASAILDTQSTTQGVGLPSMTTMQKNAISSPKVGLVVYDNVLNSLSFWNGSAWVNLTTSD